MTKSLIEKVGKRHPMIRSAMGRAGDKARIEVMKDALLSIGVCELTQKDVENEGFDVKEKRYSFCQEPLMYVVLDEKVFMRFPQISNVIKFEAAHIRNGVIGIKRKSEQNA